MAAWSDHQEESPLVGIARDAKLRETFGPVSTPEPFPLEVWTFFSDEDLDQLVVDACAEMDRREIARRSA